MINLLEGFSVWLNVVMEDQLVYWTFEHNEDDSEPTLNDSCTEHVPLTEDRDSDLILKVSNAQKLLSGEGLDDFIIDPLLEIPDVFLIVFEHGWQIWIIASHPLGLPLEEQTFDHGRDVGVNVFEMKRICSVFWDILHMAHDVVFCLSSVFKSIDEGFHIHKWVDGLFLEFVQSMHPDINVTVYLAHWVLP